MYSIDSTHDSKLQSWIESANDPRCDFPIQNLPFCVFQKDQQPTIGVGIGDKVLDLRQLAERKLIPGIDATTSMALCQESLNVVMSLSLDQRGRLRSSLSSLLNASNTSNRSDIESCFHVQSDVNLLLPCQIRNYTDFYASIFHATNVGIMLRPNNPLLPNYKHIPIGYHGRASSVVASGTPIRRPWGQIAPADEGGTPSFDTCKTLDYELEIGCFVGQGNTLGEPIGIARAEDNMFGICLLNDWSARDVQKWEYQPLGPFLAKSFATSISPWVVTMEALAPFRASEFKRPEGDPSPLPYLASSANSEKGGIDLNLEVHFRTAKMKEAGMAPIKLTSGTFAGMYWTLAQMLTHHSSNGCNMLPGDLIGSGTISGPDRSSRGSLLELTWDGSIETPMPGTSRTAFKLETGEERKFLADGDEVTLVGYCSKAGFQRIGLGSCTGTILSAHSM